MECSIKAQKIQAMKKYKRAQFLYNVILYTLTSLITCFFFSYQFSFPSINPILFSLPKIKFNSSPLDAKCLFIVANVIIFILIGESKLLRSSNNSSPVSDIYDEYVARSRSCPKMNNSDVVAKEKKEDHGCKKSMKIEEKKIGNIKNVCDIEEKKKELRACNSMHIHKEKKNVLRASKSEVWGESEIMQREKNKGKKEDQIHIPNEELNKRVEAFIARVNKQRLLEAKLVDQSRG